MEVELLKKYGSVRPGEIENLDGTTETVDFRFSTVIRFYHNMEDADFPLHWHAPGEIISPIEGTYTVTIAGKTVTLQPHDVLIIASGELHSIRAPKTGERYIMNYSVSYFHQIQDMAELFNTFYPFRLVTRQEDPELADQLFAVLAQIEGEYFSTNVYRESEIMALMLHFFSIFGRYEHRQNSEQVLDYPKQQDHMRRFAELCAYINNHCTERLSVENLASRAGFSVYHFSRLFKENTGMTCHNYLVARPHHLCQSTAGGRYDPHHRDRYAVGLQLDRNLQPPVQGADRLYPYRVPPDGLPRIKKRRRVKVPRGGALFNHS